MHMEEHFGERKLQFSWFLQSFPKHPTLVNQFDTSSKQELFKVKLPRKWKAGASQVVSQAVDSSKVSSIISSSVNFKEKIFKETSKLFKKLM